MGESVTLLVAQMRVCHGCDLQCVVHTTKDMQVHSFVLMSTAYLWHMSYTLYIYVSIVRMASYCMTIVHDQEKVFTKVFAQKS